MRRFEKCGGVAARALGEGGCRNRPPRAGRGKSGRPAAELASGRRMGGAAGSLGRMGRRNPPCRMGEGESGQSTVEFALVTFALLCLVVGVGALWRLAGDGVLADHAVQAASHHVEGSLGAVADVFSY